MRTVEKILIGFAAAGLCIVGISRAVAAPAEPAKAALAAPEPARLTAAKPVVDALFPVGTYRRLMSGTLSQMVDQMMGSMMDMKASDMVGVAGVDGKDAAKLGEQSIGALAESADPAFRERTRIMMDVMFKEMIPLMEKVEPQIRTNLTTVLARKFSPTELGDMAQFFATPSGKAYADQSMLLFMDPEIMKSMQGFVPDLLKAMPDIMKKVDAATAHLPKPKKTAAEDEAIAAVDAAAEAAEAAGAGASDPEDPTTDYANWSKPDQTKVDGIVDQLAALNKELNAAQDAAIANAKAQMKKK